MTSFIKLKNTPIKEIIFTISFNENVSLEKLDEFKALPHVSTKFTIVDKEYEAEGNIESAKKNTVDGYVLKCPSPLSRIIQARRGSFSFHKVNGYEEFEILLKELFEYWSLLMSITGHLTVNNLSVRYLNFIDKEQNEKNSDILTIYSAHPFEDGVTSSFYQINLNYDVTSDIVANVITADGDVVRGKGIILDIILDKKITGEQNNDLIFSLFNDMRKAKNDIFFKSITEGTIKKYNQ